MRILALMLGALLAGLLPPQGRADGDGLPTFEDRPQVGQPVRFTDAAGHVFRPGRLVILTPQGARAASLPATTDQARSEEHVDLSGLPLIGHLFRDRLAPGDAPRRGVAVGPVTRVGDTLVLDARRSAVALAPRDLVLTVNLPRHGAVSYRLGRPVFAPAQAPAEAGRPAGTAWLVDGVLVLAGPGYEPAVDGLERMLEDLVR